MNNCGRLACDNPAAGWWNETTQKFYCQPCAFAINDSTPGLCVRSCASPNPLDYSNESEFGDLIEVEIGDPVRGMPRRYIINILERPSADIYGSQMYITDDLKRIIALRDALNSIITEYEGK